MMTNTEFHFNESDIIFSIYSDIGELSFIEFEPDTHSAIIQSWLSQDYAAYWGMTEYSVEQLTEHYKNVLKNNLCTPYIGLVEGKPSFFIEVYDPETEGVTRYYDKQPGDVGMHILVAPAEQKISGFTYQVFMFVMEFLFSLPGTNRVVVEPDSRNSKIHQLNKRAGFFHERLIQMPGKDAYLGFCSREQFSAAKSLAQRMNQSSDKIHFNNFQHNQKLGIVLKPELASHARNEYVWQTVNRLLVKKAISELAHERVLLPKRRDDNQPSQGEFSLISDDGTSEYRFNATLLQLNHWHIDSTSLNVQHIGAQQMNSSPSSCSLTSKGVDAIRFILDFQTSLNIPQDKLATYMEEITSTLCSSAFKYTKQSLNADELVNASFQDIEISMNEGHPCFIANNGRIGFSSQDFLAYAPESGSPITLLWVAAHKKRATFSSIEQTNYETLLESELDISTRDNFTLKLRELGLQESDYLFIPVHPWQWFNKLSHVYAPDIAAKDLVCLGYGDDAYLAQQSIRTFYNISQPQKNYVKTALSILNMGFMRGLSSYYMRTTPAINAWVHNLVEQDAYLSKCNFNVLREFAAIGYSNPYYENEQVGNSPYKKMLAALWRENPGQYINDDQRLMTMASLLHIDTNGKAFLPVLIERSGLTISQWLRQYFKVYFKPLLHCLLQHKMVFMPHGENLILCLENHVPVKAFMKDIGEEVCLLNADKTQLPEDVQRIAIPVPQEEEVLAIFTDVFDCFFRFVAEILYQHADYAEDSFWRLVAECVIQYQVEHPELQQRFNECDLFAEEFVLSCLNRLQLKNNQQMVDLSDPSSSLQFSGTLKNPIAKFKPEKHTHGNERYALVSDA